LEFLLVFQFFVSVCEEGLICQEILLWIFGALHTSIIGGMCSDCPSTELTPIARGIKWRSE